MSQDFLTSDIGNLIKKLDDIPTLIESQLNVSNKIRTIVEQKYDKNADVLNLGTQVLSDFHDSKQNFVNEFDQSYDSVREMINQMKQCVQIEVDEFRKKINDVVKLFRNVQNRLKDGRDTAAQQDEIYDAIRANESELKNLRENMDSMKAVLTEKIAPVASITPQSAKFDSDEFKIEKSNIPRNPYKPLESEIATNISRVVQELFLLRNTLHTRQLVTAYTDEIVKQSKLVTNLMLKEFSPHSMEEYLRTLEQVKP